MPSITARNRLSAPKLLPWGSLLALDDPTTVVNTCLLVRAHRECYNTDGHDAPVAPSGGGSQGQRSNRETAVFIGYFTERPYQDPKSGYFGATGAPIMDLKVSNEIYDSELGANLYNRYLDEKIYAEEMGFDGLMLNEHHGTPFCMGGAMNVEAAILAKITNKAKIVLLGNILPVWDDPLWLVEQLAMIDLISRGRLVSGWVRGTGREAVAHNTPPAYNWERFQEAHEFIVKAWTTPGPFRWEGKHFQYRHVNPWVMPYQKPHPPIWLPGVVSRDSLVWAAQKRIPYVMLSTRLEPTKEAFQVYHDTATELGYQSGPQNISYLWKSSRR